MLRSLALPALQWVQFIVAFFTEAAVQVFLLVFLLVSKSPQKYYQWQNRSILLLLVWGVPYSVLGLLVHLHKRKSSFWLSRLMVYICFWASLITFLEGSHIETVPRRKLSDTQISNEVLFQRPEAGFVWRTGSSSCITRIRCHYYDYSLYLGVVSAPCR